MLVMFLVIQNSSFGQFIDVSQAAGIDNTGQNRGVAIYDYDNDGWEDIYVSRLDGSNLLYQNQGDGTFTNVAQAAGVWVTSPSECSVWGDIDNDGDGDLYVGNRSVMNSLYINNGDGTFSNQTLNSGTGSALHPKSVHMADFNLDGFLDIYIANINAANILYENNGDGTFTNIAASSGTDDAQTNLGAVVFDYDGDKDPDIYVAHDANQANILYRNNGNGTFTNVAASAGVDYMGFGMGVDVADFNLDGHLDLYITNLNENVLFLNNGNGTFSDLSATAGIQDLGMGWSVNCIDYNLDMHPDIYAVNDTYFPNPSRNNILYTNNTDGTYTPLANSVVNSAFGTYGSACFDFDNNGSADFMIANNGSDGNQLFKNSTTGNWIKFNLVGTQSNRDGVGARVRVNVGGTWLADEVISGSGYCSQSSLGIHFGLGNNTFIDSIHVSWPSGAEDRYGSEPGNATYTLTENSTTVNRIDLMKNVITVRTHPNPTSEILNIEWDAAEVKFIKIRNLNGKLIRILPLSGNSKQLDVSEYNSGIYFIQLFDESHQQLGAKRVVVGR